MCGGGGEKGNKDMKWVTGAGGGDSDPTSAASNTGTDVSNLKSVRLLLKGALAQFGRT